MAAGLSRRSAPRNKLLLRDDQGVAMVARVADAVLASRARPVLAVVGHQAAAVTAALAGRAPEGRELGFVEARDYAAGMAASLRAGIAALPADASGVLVCLGDMPLVTPVLLDRLIAASEAEGAPDIVAPSFQGRRGNPVLWRRCFFDAMMSWNGDSGGRALLLSHRDRIGLIDTGDPGVLTDFDEGGPGWNM